MKSTKIFPHNVLPVRSGVYRTQALGPDDLLPNGDWSYSYFDATDRIWGCSSTTPEQAFKQPDFEFAWQVKQWYGLTDPQS